MTPVERYAENGAIVLSTTGPRVAPIDEQAERVERAMALLRAHNALWATVIEKRYVYSNPFPMLASNMRLGERTVKEHAARGRAFLAGVLSVTPSSTDSWQRAHGFP